jgi:hypothetical protein
MIPSPRFESPEKHGNVLSPMARFKMHLIAMTLAGSLLLATAVPVVAQGPYQPPRFDPDRWKTMNPIELFQEAIQTTISSLENAQNTLVHFFQGSQDQMAEDRKGRVNLDELEKTDPKMAQSLRDTYEHDDNVVPSILDMLFKSPNDLINSTKGNVQQLNGALPSQTPTVRTGPSPSTTPTRAPTRIAPTLIPTRVHP